MIQSTDQDVEDATESFLPDPIEKDIRKRIERNIKQNDKICWEMRLGELKVR